ATVSLVLGCLWICLRHQSSRDWWSVRGLVPVIEDSPGAASHAARGPGYHARQGWFGRTLTRTRSPDLLLVQPDLGRHAPVLNIIKIDASHLVLLLQLLCKRFLTLHGMGMFLHRRNDFSLPGSRSAKRFEPKAEPPAAVCPR